jgi:hypothetical protein
MPSPPDPMLSFRSLLFRKSTLVLPHSLALLYKRPQPQVVARPPFPPPRAWLALVPCLLAAKIARVALAPPRSAAPPPPHSPLPSVVAVASVRQAPWLFVRLSTILGPLKKTKRPLQVANGSRLSPNSTLWTWREANVYVLDPISTYCMSDLLFPSS